MQALFDIGTCLKELHEAGYVHRDIKPSNVINLPVKQVRLCAHVWKQSVFFKSPAWALVLVHLMCYRAG